MTTILLADLYHRRNQSKTFPYAAGCVGAHAKVGLEGAVDVRVFRDCEELGAAFGACPPDVLGFTNYLWNLELTYDVVRRAKAASSRTVVVFGGPNYPIDADGQRAFLERYPLVDFYVDREGEIPFLELVRALRDAGFDAEAWKRERREIPAVHYLAAGELVAPAPLARQRELDAFPSPYLIGLLDPFFARPELVPLVQTQRGCPFQCTFRVEGDGYYSKIGSRSIERLRAELDYIAPRMSGGSPALHIADSNFGMYEHDLEICDVIAEVRDRWGWPETIEVSTGKNRKERVLEAVKRTNGAIRFGPALQSTDPGTLRNVKRSNISRAVLMDMARAAIALDQRSYTELILGLPGDTVASFLASIRDAMDAGMQRIKVYPLVLLPGTEMYGAASRREFGLETRFRIVPQCHGTYGFLGEEFPAIDVDEMVIGTSAMPFADYLHCKRFQLSVEIFYNDLYLEEIHGLARGLGLPMFDVVERCHAALESFPVEVRRLYDTLEEGIREGLWASREACLEHYRRPGSLEAYAAGEYKKSVASIKAVGLIDHIEPILATARAAVADVAAEAGVATGSLAEYLEELTEFSRLRRRRILDCAAPAEGTFSFDFDRIAARRFRVQPDEFRLPGARRMHFWHDDGQAREIRTLRAEIADPVLLARSFIYPRTDPGVNPYLRRARFV